MLFGEKIPETGTTTFHDEVYGTITVENSSLDEGVLLKSDGMPTYNFANVVDDSLMKLPMLSGEASTYSTPKYNLLYEAFGWEIPTYIHLPLILREDGGKLSKRHGDASFEDLYNQGYLPEAIINYIALLGWSPGTEEEFFTLEELVEKFDIKGLNKSPAIFDINKLRWMNGQYIRRKTLKEFHELALPYYQEVITNPDVDLLKLSKLLHTRTEVLDDIYELIDFIAELPDYDVQLYVHKKMKTTLESSKENLIKAYDVLTNLDEWQDEAIHDAIFKLIKDLGIKTGQMMWPIRTALSGKQSSPGGATELLSLLGKEESLKRIKIGIEKLSDKLS